VISLDPAKDLLNILSAALTVALLKVVMIAPLKDI